MGGEAMQGTAAGEGFLEYVDPAHTALLVVDVQNDFCHPDGAFGRLRYDVSPMAAMADALASLIDAARRHGVLTVFVRAEEGEALLGRAMGDNYRRRGFSGGLCVSGSWGSDWFGPIRPRGGPGEVSLVKHRYSAFWGTPIDLYLRSNGITTVVVTGVVTSVCVDYTAADAFFNDYRVVVPSDCVASTSHELHEASLRRLRRSFGLVVAVKDIMEVWSRAGEEPRPWMSSAKASRVLRDLPTRVTPRHTALVLVDLQNDFCHREGAMGRRGEDLEFIQATVPRIAELLGWARAAGVMVIHVKAEYGPLSASAVTLANRWEDGDGPPCCEPGTWGAEFVSAVRPRDGEPVVVKHRYSGFVDTRLELLLRSNGIRTVVIAGVATHCCVESTARDANMRDYYVVIPEDCVAVRGKMRHLHEAALETLGTYFGLVVPSAAVREVWRAPKFA
jgi:nicotinamidase-related amidase